MFLIVQWIQWKTYRSSCLEVFCRKGFLRNLAKCTRKHLCQRFFLFADGLWQFRNIFFLPWWDRFKNMIKIKVYSLLTLNLLSANSTKWSNTLKQFVGCCLSVFDHFVELALKRLKVTVNLFLVNLSHFIPLFLFLGAIKWEH